MSDTPRLKMPMIAASQAQKHVTHNEALIQLDALASLYILDRDLTAPPGSPADGDTYLVAASATGDWAGKDGLIAFALDGAWRFFDPVGGLRAYIDDEQAVLIYDGSAWVDLASVLSLQNVPLVGINTTADATNKLAVKSNAILFDAWRTGGGGNGDVQVKLSKQAYGNTASLLYQANYSGRAEMGLTGDNDFHVKVSPDGSTWYDALIVDKDNGNMEIPGTLAVGSNPPNFSFSVNGPGTQISELTSTDGGAVQFRLVSDSDNNRRILVTNNSGTVKAQVQFADSGVNFYGQTTQDVYMFIDTSGIQSQGVYDTTTANAANTHVASDGRLKRSTSARKYKRDIEGLDDQRRDAALQLRPVWYRSSCKDDNQDWSYYGLIAEEVATVDPRLVHWRTTEPVVCENDDDEPYIEHVPLGGAGPGRGHV